MLATACWFATNSAVYNTCALNPFLAYSLAGFALIHLRLQPKWVDALSIIGAASVLVFVDIEFLGRVFAPYAVLGIIGVVSVAAIGVRAICTLGAKRRGLALAFAFAVLSVSANGIAGLAHNAIARLTPRVLDLYLCDFDASLRVQPSFWMGQVYATHHWFGYLGLFVYFGFPLVIALALAGQLVRDRREVISAMMAFLITGPLGVILYGLYPALGPMYIFTDRFPWHPLTMDELYRLRLDTLELPGLRNSMPSLHIAWVLLALWYSRKLSVYERAIAVSFVALTICATLGTGEHYFIDLVVACPFALFVYAFSDWEVAWGRERILASIAGIGLTLLWIQALHFNVKMFWISPAIPWAACIATVAVALALQQRLAHTSVKATNVDVSAAAPVLPSVSRDLPAPH